MLSHLSKHAREEHADQQSCPYCHNNKNKPLLNSEHAISIIKRFKLVDHLIMYYLLSRSYTNKLLKELGYQASIVYLKGKTT